MEINLNNITFIIVAYKSENIIFDCINSLPKNSKKIVIENSQNNKLKKDLEAKYDNIEVLVRGNLGMGTSNNIGIKKADTQFVYILNPDTIFQNDTFDKLVESVKKINDFDLITPVHSNKNYPNYKTINNNDLNKNIISVNFIDGFSMILNLKKFNKNSIFDENIFLYLENDDLCMRVKKQNGNIYVIKDSKIDHLGASSSNLNSHEFECLRNWHWMWSKFYFNKKHYGFGLAILKVITNLLSSLIKYSFFFLILNKNKKDIYKMRTLGLLSSIFGKKSVYRIDN
tara:strand:+ start:317 stop:1171 length:855 start_codon:yes stop_codon:yes gene_type:complete